MARKKANGHDLGDPVAGNGLLHRRAFLEAGVLAASAATVSGAASAQSIGAAAPQHMTRPGAPFRGYGMPSRWREQVQRIYALNPGREGSGSSRTPLQFLEGTITPNGLHFERHHNGVPDIDPAQHALAIHGLARRPLVFSVDTLLNYPMESRTCFVECAGNSGGLTAVEPAQAPVGQLHGLLSCSEWTGVRLATLLDEAGVAPGARWVIAEGADAAAMSRSIPLAKCMDDAVVALFQNGEPIRPEQGFPMRLLLPGYEGNANVKWLRRLKLSDAPAYARDETSRYSDLMRDGKARLFTLDLGVKSVILKPSFGLTMRGPGLYEISGLAWSGLGRVTRVEISADGGASWADAALTEPVLSKALTRFRLPWRWNGQPATLLSRASDERGTRQPERAAWIAQYGPGQNYHYNAIVGFSVGASGEIRNVYA
jgi:sulfane dehydrogenase subunit SoxC